MLAEEHGKCTQQAAQGEGTYACHQQRVVGIAPLPAAFRTYEQASGQGAGEIQQSIKGFRDEQILGEQYGQFSQ